MNNILFNSNMDLWRRGLDGGGNAEQLERLLAYLPQAIEEELTDRQRQMVGMYFYQNMNASQIARELQLNPSTVSRTLHRATQRLQRVLRYAM